MKRLKKNWAYAIVGLVAIVLVGLTILLQIAILSNQQSLPGPINEPSNPEATKGIEEAQTAILTEATEIKAIDEKPIEALVLAGDPAAEIVVTNSKQLKERRDDESREDVEHSSGIGGQIADPQPNPIPISSIETLTITTVPTLVPPTAIAVPVVAPIRLPDLRLSTIGQNTNCQFFTDMSEQLLEQALEITIEQVSFDDAAQLFADLASTESHRQGDLTLCFIDPEDRVYISQYFGYIKLLGSAYWRQERQRLQIMANASIVAPLEREKPCLYIFFQNLHFEDQPIEEIDLEGKVAELQGCEEAEL